MIESSGDDHDATMSLRPRPPGATVGATVPLPAGIASWGVTLPPADGMPEQLAATPLPLGPSSAQYEFVRLLGQGGMGEVWEARQISLCRTVALKRITPSRLRGTDADHVIGEFRHEAVLSAQLEHPNIVPVHDLGSGADGTPLLAMKLVDGRP
jgi:serine/threonine protein kinase